MPALKTKMITNKHHYNHQHQSYPSYYYHTLRQQNPYGTSKTNSFSYKKLLLFILFSGFVLYFLLVITQTDSKLLNLTYQLRSSRTNSLNLEDPFGVVNYKKSYFIYLIGCKMPSFPVVDNMIAQYISRATKFNCSQPLFESDSNSLRFLMNETEFRKYFKLSQTQAIGCQYFSFKRKTDMSNRFSIEGVNFTIGSRITVDKEFVKIICRSGKIKLVEDIHIFPELRKYSTVQFQKEDKISVLVIGIDSVSRLNFHRQMRRTASVLSDELNAVEFFGFNKVGDNTYPNLVPILTGLDENELRLACLPNGINSTFDQCPFIWNNFKKKGFRTAYGEDVAQLGTFNYFKKGFIQQPTDYYIRPALIEMEKSTVSQKKYNMYLCLGNRRPADVIFDYVRKMTPKFLTENFFSFFWMASLTHDYFNMPTLLDDDLAKFLQDLNKSGVLNKTVLVLLSDHGIRWGAFRKTYQGMMEERQPLLFIAPPKWFGQIHPEALENLKTNSRRLMTHFDIHSTFSDLLDLESLKSKQLQSRAEELEQNVDNMPRAISLFLPLPKERTCENAGIASHWCTCHEEIDLPTNDPRVQKSARFLVALINRNIRTHEQCRPLYLNSILKAVVSSSNKVISKNSGDDFFIDITVRIQTKPGYAEFEGTVRLSESFAELTGTISRTNLYGRQSFCMNDSILKLFCYCK